MASLVTGATGFLGRALVRALLQQGETVYALVRPGRQTHALKGLDVEVREADLLDPGALVKAFTGIDHVYHTAGIHRLNATFEDSVRVNVIGTRHVLDAASQAGVQRIVIISNDTTCGSATEAGPADEDTVWDLGSLNVPYLTAAYVAEVEALRAAVRGNPVVIVNPGGMLGDWDLPPSPAGRWLIEYLNGRLPAVPEFYLNIVDVDDVARGALAAMRQGRIGERYLLTNWNTTLGEYLGLAGRLVGVKAPKILPHEVAATNAIVGGRVLQFFGLSPSTSSTLARLARKRLHYNNAKAVRELGFTTTPVEETVDRAVRWFQAAGFLKKVKYGRTE